MNGNIEPRKLRRFVRSWKKAINSLFFLISVGILAWNLFSRGLAKDQLISPTVTPSVTVKTEAPVATDEAKTLYAVVGVVDGDTVKVDVAGVIQTVRLIGIDTPETVDPRQPVQCFGREASLMAKKILSRKKITLEKDASQGDKDKYRRLLRYVFLEDGTNFNKMMISEGFAHEYTYDKPYKYMEEFKNAEKLARQTGKGLWKEGVCPVTAYTSSKKQ